MRKTSTDRCLDVLIAFGGYARRPLETIFRENEALQNLKLTFIYGETDFFLPKHAEALIKDGTLKRAKVFIVPAMSLSQIICGF